MNLVVKSKLEIDTKLNVKMKAPSKTEAEKFDGRCGKRVFESIHKKGDQQKEEFSMKKMMESESEDGLKSPFFRYSSSHLVICLLCPKTCIHPHHHPLVQHFSFLIKTIPSKSCAPYSKAPLHQSWKKYYLPLEIHLTIGLSHLHHIHLIPCPFIQVLT